MSQPTLVLVHGLLGSVASFDALLPALAGRRVHAVTLPGHAGDRRPVPDSFDGAADRLASDLGATLGDEPVDLVGYSLGARVALALCARHPERFRRAVLVSVHPGLTDEAARRVRRAEDEVLARLVETRGMTALVDAWEARPIFATQRALAPALQARQRAVRLEHEPAAIAAAIRHLGLAEMASYGPALQSLASRVALVVGERDEKFRALARAIAERAPGLLIETIAGAGHNPILEAPVLTAARIRPLLDQPTGAATAPASTKEQRR